MKIDFEGLPDINDAEFKSYIKRPSGISDQPKPQPQQHGDKKSEDRRQRATYASFGDSGTTASINGYGTIMRLNRYLGGEKNPSKMFGLEFSEGDCPYFVKNRADVFQEQLVNPNSGFGLQIMGADSLQPTIPHLEFLHDRWPQITYSVKGFSVGVRLFCQKGIVIQHFTVTNTLDSAENLDLSLALDFRMYDLDYMNSPVEEAIMEYKHGPHGHSVIVLDQTTERKNEDGTLEQMGVLVGLFRNGESEKYLFSSFQDISNRRRVKKYSLQGSETLELTAAFRLQYLKCSSVWKDFIMPISDMDVSEIVQKPVLALDRWPFPGNHDLSWHLRRNLEHILSVCSIPLEDIRDHSVTPIALTCGDFGDHLVSVSGSFFAFKYLLSMYEQLGNREAQSLRSRIHDTCKGHLKWVSKLNYARAFASNFWVDGKIVERDLGTDIPQDSPANIPTHILKVTEFLKVFKELEELIFVSKWLPLFFRHWIQNLIGTKNHLTTTWRHLLDDSDIGTYRLSDHVWIWKALESIEKLIANVEERNHSSPHPSMEKILELRDYLPNRRNKVDKAGPRLTFTADQLRKQILRRFTLENDISKKRMLSVTRSARETRFLFHSRDTVLYYGIEWGFFRDDSQSVSELWKLLAQSQPLHDESNDELQWDNPLRYALAVLMGLENHQLDKNYSVPEMSSHAKKVLLDSSSENGLFPGQIDETTKEPVLFDREGFRDFYFHAGFEIPYVLLRAGSKGYYQDGERGGLDVEGTKTPEHEKEINGNEATRGLSRSLAQDRQPKRHPIRRSMTAQSSQLINTVDRFQARLEPSENRDSAAVGNNVRNIPSDGVPIVMVRSLKRHIPYGNLSNTVEMSEEWLYDYPRFLNFLPPNDEDSATILKQADGPTIADLDESTDEFSIRNLLAEDTVESKFTIIDVPKGKKRRKREVSEPSVKFYKEKKYRQIWSKLREERTAKDAKKRLIYIGPGDRRVAALCYLASPETERENISQFFDRHATSRDFIHDDTIIASNVWETELHLSFYELVKGKPTERRFPAVRAVEFRNYSSLGQDCVISEAAIGFRIVGDFIDRYWTCHIIENFSKCDDEDFNEFKHDLQKHWQQRKVLELILFEHILSKVHQSAEEIIDAIGKDATNQTNTGEKPLFGSLHFEGRDMASLRENLEILVVLKKNFASIHEIIDLWEVRESTHGQERPRWTRNDEQKYRRFIKTCSARQERRIRDLRNQHALIDFLITLVTSAQEANRSTRSLHEAANIRLFTYITVVFLPVGLASSFFGMSQIPERNVIITMIITAIIALLLTVLALYCIFSKKVATKRKQLRKYIKDKKRKRQEPKSVPVWTKMKELLSQRFRPSKGIAKRGPAGGVTALEEGLSSVEQSGAES